MKKLIVATLIVSTLTGCAARNADGSKIYNADGSEKISWVRTALLPVAIIGGAALIIAGAKAGDNGNSGNSNYQPYQQPTALCNDGTYSYSQHNSGTCSYHGGVKYWYN